MNRFMVIFFLFVIITLGRMVTVVRVIDGDTFILDDKKRVRLVGVDTPETKDPRKDVQYYGQEAYRYTQNALEGKIIDLQLADDSLDVFGRLLGYVYIDGKLYNEKIISDGYAYAYVKYSYNDSIMLNLVKAEVKARRHRRGLWGIKPNSYWIDRGIRWALRHPQMPSILESEEDITTFLALVNIYLKKKGIK